jgi:ribonuclease P protein component
MLPRKNRLKKATEIDEVFRKGRLWQSPSFSVKFLIREGEAPRMRVAFSFGKKYLRRAIDRNRLKRRLSEAIALYAAEARIAVDAVFFLQKAQNPPEQAILSQEVENFVSRLYNSFK